MSPSQIRPHADASPGKATGYRILSVTRLDAGVGYGPSIGTFRGTLLRNSLTGGPAG